MYAPVDGHRQLAFRHMQCDLSESSQVVNFTGEGMLFKSSDAEMVMELTMAEAPDSHVMLHTHSLSEWNL